MRTEKPNITLQYRPNDPDGPWLMSVDATDPPKGGQNIKKLKAPAGEDAEFIFTIKTPHIKFKEDNPIALKFMSGEAPGDTDQFTRTVSADGTQLTVNDANEDSELTEYYYQLNFVGKPPLDPIIQNGCCKSRDTGTGGIQLMSVTGAIVVVLVAALLASLIFAFFRWAK